MNAAIPHCVATAAARSDPRRSLDSQASLDELTLLLLASVELGEILDALARHAGRMFLFDRLDIALRDDNGVDQTVYNLHDERGAGVRVRTSRLVRGDASALDGGRAGSFGICRGLDQGRVCAVMTVPLVADERVLGALSFYALDLHAYSADDLLLARRLALPITHAVRHAMLHARERRRNQKLQAIHRVGAAATTSLERDELLAEACRQISAEFGYYKVNLALIDEESVHIAPCHRIFHGRTLPADKPADRIPRTVPSLMTTAANERRVVHAPDVAAEPSYYCEPGSQTRSELAIPIVWRGQAFGILDVQSEKVDAFKEEDIQLLVLLANQLAAGLENCRLYDQANTLLDTYVPTPVARHLRAQPERPVAGGKRQRITVLFADLRGFTSYAEGRDPEDVLQLLNRYLGEAAEAIAQCGGTLDKFMGDGFMALFNAPEEQDDHALRAVRAAQLVQQRVRCLRLPDGDELCFGIGINTGEAVVGNLGASAILNYTAVGDAVNVAKRLQENAAGGQIVLSAETYAALRGQAIAQPLGPLSLHHRREPVEAYLLRSVEARTEPATA